MNIFQNYATATTKDELDAAYDALYDVLESDRTIADDVDLVDALDNWLRAAGMPSYAQRLSAIKFDLV